MTGANIAGAPVWVAALVAVACQAKRRDGGGSGFQWLPGAECVHYTAIDEVTVEPFGIALSKGAVLEVRWPAGATGYSLEVLPPGLTGGQ